MLSYIQRDMRVVSERFDQPTYKRKKRDLITQFSVKPRTQKKIENKAK